jgi:hypothetical protein
MCGAFAFTAHAQQPQNWPTDDDYNAQSAPVQIQSVPQLQYAYESQPQTYAPQGQQGNAQRPLSAEELTQLVAPIALYPDPLVAQILAASTYPAQISAANQWLHSMGNAPAEQIAAGADAQTSWDPSVKALTAFPQVLGMLDQNLQWTTDLGNAYYNQPQDVMQTIQVLRQRAEQAGNLQSTPQEQVYDNQGTIGIAPANPQMVYVPSYDPWTAYGDPVAPYPGFSLLGAIGSWIGSGFMHFGPGVAMSAFLGTPWGWLGWGLDWLAHTILFQHDDYWTNSSSVRDWGFPYGGPRWGGRDWGHGYYGGRYGDRSWGREGGRDYGRNDGYSNGSPHPRGGPEHGQSGDARSIEGFNRGFPQRGAIQGREGSLAYNRAPEQFTRTQSPQSFALRQPGYGGAQNQFNRPAYGNGFAAQPRSGLAQRQGGGMAFANPTYRAPQLGYSAPQSTLRAPMGGSRGNNAYAGGSANGYSPAPHAGSYYGAGRGASLPRSFSYSASPSFGGGHSSWSAPRQSHSFSGGGSHSFFGGGHSSSGGGHSFSGGSHGGGGSGSSHGGGGGGHHR